MKIICNYNNFKKIFSKEYEKLPKISKKSNNFALQNHAVVAQLVEHGLPKPRVAGSNPVYRSLPHHLHVLHYCIRYVLYRK